METITDSVKKAETRPKKATKKTTRETTRRASPPKSGASSDPHFPVVGVGASAGGLEAFTQVLKNLSPATGMAFVLVQHLAPKQDSFLKELLARTTKMPVAIAQTGMVVERDHVYVIAPNTDLEISGGRFVVRPRAAARSPHYPVDQFLQSLAMDRGSLAIGVILSGTASDGTLGLKAIKSEGGITFAQSEASAKYPGMPSSAISAGFVDYVLPPEKIARELARLGRHPYLHLHPAAPPIPAEGDGHIAKLFSLLRNTTGVDFTHYKHTTLRRRITRRMVVQKIDKLADYLTFVKNHPEELQALYHDILISVTSFFRDKAMYRALNKSVFPRLMRKRPQDGPVRIWVPGCSTGEEAYSIAISLSEFMRQRGMTFPIQVFATDINDAAIERARSGIYPERISAEVPAEVLRRYFTAVNSGYQVSHPLRELCVFARQNVARDAPFSKLDLISCRNLLIYLAPVLQRRVLTVFHYALKPAAFLVLGNSETVGSLSEHFSLLDKKNKIYSKKGTLARLNMDFQVSDVPPEKAVAGRRVPESWGPEDATREADRVLLDRHTPAGVVINDAMKVLQFRGRTGRFLEPEPGEATLNLFRMAREGMLPDLRTVIYRAKKKDVPARIEDVQVSYEKGSLTVAIEAIPLDKRNSKEQYMLVLFEEQARQPAAPGRPQGTKSESRNLRRLKQELNATKQYLQSIIEEQEANNEELKSANEEIQSSNEELQSTNEEMETAKEELQSTNEELTTVNEELQNRNLELAQANNDLSNLLSSVQIPLVMVDSELRLRRFTPSAEKLLNLIPTDIARPLLDIKPNIDVPDLHDILTDVIENLRVVQRETRDHTGHEYSMWARPYRTSENKIDGAVLAFVDVSALKRSMEQSRDFREYAEAIAATVHEPVVVLDGSLRVVTANAPFYKVFALAPGRTENVPFFEIASGQWDLPALRDALNGLAKGDGITHSLEITANFGSAGTKALFINLRRMPTSGNPRLILLAIQDISARRFAENALTREAPVGILQIDPEGGATFINPRACAIAGVSEQEALGFGWLKNMQPEDQVMLRSKIAGARAKNEGFTIEARLAGPAGKIEWVLLVAIPLTDPHGDLAGYLGALTDVTNRKDLEDQLRHSQKMEAVGRLAGGVAHDFNNMLTAIGTYTAQLFAAVPENNPARTLAVQIGRIVDQAAVTTRQLLAFSRKQVLRPMQVRINAVLDAMHDLLTRLLGDSVEVVLALARDAGTVVVDPGQLQQIILNLAINSRDAMPNGGKVIVSTESVSLDAAAAQREGLPSGDYVCLAVSDTGMGIDAGIRDRLFEPFFTTKPPGAGTGLGLSMVYGIVQQSGGSIHVESEPGRGTTFRILLPRVAGVEEPEPAPVEGGDARGSETILLVEDSPVVRSLVRELLEQRGYKVMEARDALEAISIAGKHHGRIDLLLTDLMMPRMGGHELAKRLRRRRKGLKVIYMSGYSGDGLEAVEKDSNFLEKPFKPETLAAFVRKVLDDRNVPDKGKSRPISSRR